jgi:alkaline phosphatase
MPARSSSKHPSLFAALILLLALSSACGLPGVASLRNGDPRSAEPTEASQPAPDPRSQNAWFRTGRARAQRAARMIDDEPPARNVILFVGDGMGLSTITAARILEGQRRGESGEANQLSFESFPFVALSKTYNVDAQVPDSASTMTALTTGVKTLTGVIGVDETIQRGDHASVEQARIPTILEEAEQRGLETGIVTTTTVTHATPASCYAHAPLRFWENDSAMSKEAREADFPDLARQLVEFPGPGGNGDGLEVALGGGRHHFRPRGEPDPEDATRPGRRLDGRDLTTEWQARRDDATYVWRRDQLLALDLDRTGPLLGLFEPGDMNWEVDRAGDEVGEPSLAEMTRVAIDLLSQSERGFFLMVEGGRIDHGHHAGNAHRALVDTIAFSDAVRVALDHTDPAETLIVVTADHSHTLTISGYPKRGNPILGKVVGVDWTRGGGEIESRDALGLPYTTLSYANGPGYSGASADQPAGAHAYPHQPCDRSGQHCGFKGAQGRPDLSEVDTTAPDYLQEATVPFGTETHAGEDVPVYATGPGAALFHGVQEQSYFYHAMVEALGWTRTEPSDD